MSRLLRSLVVRGLSGCVLAGCTASGPAPEEAAPEPRPAAVSVEAPREVEAPKEAPKVVEAPAEPPKPAPVEAPTLEAKIEVAACDDYVGRYRACLDRMPEADKTSHTAAVREQMAAWLAARADPKLAAALAEECAAAAVAARAATRVYGCVWREGDSPTPERPKGGKPLSPPRGVERELLEPF